MRLAVIFLLFAFPTLAQERASVNAPAPASANAPAPACGSGSVRYVVKLDNVQHTVGEAEPGKALVYFIQDKGRESFGIGGGVETKVGIDGAWVGANRNNSYFAVSIEPGEHHLCSEEQTFGVPDIQLAHFEAAEAGKVYYYRVSVVFTRVGLRFFLNPLDSDQAKYLIASFPLSVSHARN